MEDAVTTRGGYPSGDRHVSELLPPLDPGRITSAEHFGEMTRQINTWLADYAALMERKRLLVSQIIQANR
jgi:hypothetical protein